MNHQGLIFVFFLLFLAEILAQEVIISNCADTDPKGWCKINKIEIDNCKEAGTSKPCIIKKGKTHKIKIHYTVLKPFETMKSLPYWAAATGDLPFIGMSEEACDFTKCPAEANTDQLYDFGLKIARSLPRGTFDVKWKFWTNGNKENGCCAKLGLKLT